MASAAEEGLSGASVKDETWSEVSLSDEKVSVDFFTFLGFFRMAWRS